MLGLGLLERERSNPIEPELPMAASTPVPATDIAKAASRLTAHNPGG